MRLKHKSTAWNSSVDGRGLSPGSGLVTVLRKLVDNGGRCAEFPASALTSIDSVVRREWAREDGDELVITPAGRQVFERVTSLAGKAR